MTRFAAAMFVATLIAAGCAASDSTTRDEDAWITLFDGTSLDGWRQVGAANWRLADGTVEATEGNGYLVSEASYRDFELQVEFWMDEATNSGVFIRCTDPERITPETSYEVNAWDERPDQTYRTGSIVNVAAPRTNVDAGGRWNTFEIRAQGPRLVVVLNDVETVDVEDGTFPEGPIALQSATGLIRFRSVRIRPL